jgi:preprotein translocase subunit SecE
MANQPVQTVSTTNDKIKVVTAICAVVAGVVGFYFLADKSAWIRNGVFVAGLLLAVGMLWTSTLGRNFVGFAKESLREAKKVVWPTRKETTQTTLVVFGFVLIMALFLWGTDKLLETLLYSFLLSWK